MNYDRRIDAEQNTVYCINLIYIYISYTYTIIHHMYSSYMNLIEYVLMSAYHSLRSKPHWLSSH